MKIAFLGTGLLGYPMAERLLKAGRQVAVYNRTLKKAEPLAELGAIICERPAEAIRDADCIVLVLTDAKAVEDVLFSASPPPLAGKTVIQMGTIASAQSIELQKKVYEHGGEYFECPVLGSRTEALEGRLILLVGATQEKFDEWADFLKVFGPHPRRIGKVGKAAALKLALNQLIAAHAVSFSVSLGLVEHNEIDPQVFADILKESSLYAPMFDKKLDNWLKRRYENPNFPLRHILKDVTLTLTDAREKGLAVESLEAMEKIYRAAIRDGLGDKDYSAVFNAISKVKS